MSSLSDNVPAEQPRQPGECNESSVDGSAVSVLGDFELRREIGRGGMGTVYEAWQRSLQRVVAVKVLGRQVSSSPSAVTRFRREAQAAARLHHTNIVPTYALGEEEGVYFFAMEQIDGPGLNIVISNLRSTATRSGESDELAETVLLSRTAKGSDEESLSPGDSGTHRLAAPTQHQPDKSGSGVTLSQRDERLAQERFTEVATHIAGVADALDYAHRQGVIHRDIKPHNLLLSSDGKLMVSDFGLARLSEQPGVTVTGEVIGSPLYMSPEQISSDNAPVDHRADIYALGATMYEWLTLSPPYPGETRERVISKVLTSEAPSLISHDPTIPMDLATICQKAIERDPARRYQSAGELRDDLHRFIENRPIKARRASTALRSFRFIARHQLASMAAAAIVVAVTLGWALLSKGRDLKTQTAAVEEVQEDRERLLDDILSLMPAEIGGPIRLAEAAVPMLKGMVGGSPREGGDSSGRNVTGADPSAAGTTAGIVRRFAHDLYEAYASPDWPVRPVDADDEVAQLALHALELWNREPVTAMEQVGSYLQKDPKRFEAWQLQAALLGRLGQGPLMLEAVDAMAQLRPDDSMVGVWRAVAFLLEDDAVSSLKDLTRSHQDGDMVPWLLTLRSLALARVGAALEAFLALNEALDRQPDLVVALLARASIQASAGNSSGAIADLGRVLKIEPNNADVLGLRGDRYVEVGDYEAAAHDYDRAMNIAGRSPNMVLRYLYSRTQGRDSSRETGTPAVSIPTVKTGAAPSRNSTGGLFGSLISRFL